MNTDKKQTYILWYIAVFVVFAVLGGYAAGRSPVLKSNTVENEPEKIIEYTKDFEPDVKKPIDLDALREEGLPVLICCGDNSYSGRVDMYNAVKRVNNEFKNKAFVYYVNIDEFPEAAEGLFVPAIPTIICIDAAGQPFVPEDSLDDKYGFKMYYDPFTKKPMYTYHLGSLNRWELRELLHAMGEK